MRGHQYAKTSHAGTDQYGIGQRSYQDHGQDVLAPDALPEDEGVLRPDGDDQGQAGCEADEGRGHD